MYGINALAFVGPNHAFSKSGRADTEAERKRHDLEEEKLQKTQDKSNADRIKLLDFIIKRLRQRNKAEACITNVDEAMLKYYQVFVKRKKPF